MAASLYPVNHTMDRDQPRDATAEHERRGDKCEAQPAGGKQTAMSLKDYGDVSALVHVGRPLREFAIDARHHCHLEQAAADGAHKTSRTKNNRQQEQGHSNLAAILRRLKQIQRLVFPPLSAHLRENKTQ